MAQAGEFINKQYAVHLKSHPKTWRAPQAPIAYAFLKLLREHDKTRKVYDVDPYAEVYQFRDNLYGIYEESLDGMGDVWSFLILGPQKAMLIDTGFGIGDLKGLCRLLAGERELIVACTHAHFDHAYGNHQFDAVYCHEYEVPMMEQATHDPHLRDYLMSDDGTTGRWCDFDPADLIAYSEYEIRGVADHTRFDLGEGYEIELIHTGGHTAGHAMYLDHHNHILFAGDDACYGGLSIGACPPNPYSRWATVEGMRDCLQNLAARKNEIEAVFPGHVAVDILPEYLDNIVETCNAVLAHPDCYDKRIETGMAGEPQLNYCKMIHESGYLMYGPEKIFMDRQ